MNIQKISLVVIGIILLGSFTYFLSNDSRKEDNVMPKEHIRKEEPVAPRVQEAVKPPVGQEKQAIQKSFLLPAESEAGMTDSSESVTPVKTQEKPSREIPALSKTVASKRPVPMHENVTAPMQKTIQPSGEITPAQSINALAPAMSVSAKVEDLTPSPQTEPVKSEVSPEKPAVEKLSNLSQNVAAPVQKSILPGGEIADVQSINTVVPAMSVSVKVEDLTPSPQTEPVKLEVSPEKPAVEKLSNLPQNETTELPVKKDITTPEILSPEPVIAPLPQIAEERKYSGGPADIAFLPFDNFSQDKKAGEKVIAALKLKLVGRGLKVLDWDAVNAFLCREKVRVTGYLSGEVARKLHDEFQVQSILAGSVISFSSGEDPQIGLVARLINTETGVIVWADYAFVSGEDFASILGLGKVRNVERLVPRAIDRLLSSFHVNPPKREKEKTYRVAVIPFQNRSGFDGAGMVAMYMFLVELLRQAPFEPIEFGDVRKMIIGLQVRSNGEIDYQRLSELSKALDADTVLVGTVERYPSGLDTSTSSVISMTARLLDARNNKILWYNTHQLNSEKNVIAFEWGEKEPADRVAYGVVASMVKKMKAALLQ